VILEIRRSCIKGSLVNEELLDGVWKCHGNVTRSGDEIGTLRAGRGAHQFSLRVLCAVDLSEHPTSQVVAEDASLV
jgi:hypothetical protein